MKDFAAGLLTIFTGVVTLAIISVILSRKAQTAGVLQAGSTALAKVVSAAVSPVGTAATNGALGLSAFSTPAIPSDLLGLG